MELEIQRKGKPVRMVKNIEWVWNGALSRQVKGRDAKRTLNRIKQFAYVFPSDRILCVDQKKGK